MAATAAETLLETFENILISFRFETIFRITAKMLDTLHEPCQFYNIYIFQWLDKNNCSSDRSTKLIFGAIS
jgi:hypothetical protein